MNHVWVYNDVIVWQLLIYKYRRGRSETEIISRIGAVVYGLSFTTLEL